MVSTDQWSVYNIYNRQISSSSNVWALPSAIVLANLIKLLFVVVVWYFDADLKLIKL